MFILFCFVFWSCFSIFSVVSSAAWWTEMLAKATFTLDSCLASVLLSWLMWVQRCCYCNSSSPLERHCLLSYYVMWFGGVDRWGLRWDKTFFTACDFTQVKWLQTQLQTQPDVLNENSVTLWGLHHWLPSWFYHRYHSSEHFSDWQLLLANVNISF